jgi:yeast amino acid transporter
VKSESYRLGHRHHWNSPFRTDRFGSDQRRPRWVEGDLRLSEGRLNAGLSGSLFLAFTIWSTFILAVSNCLCTSLFLLRSIILIYSQRKWSHGFRYLHLLFVSSTINGSTSLNHERQVRFADRFVDPALGFCAGINFFALEASLVPFEVVAFNVVLQFWTDKIPTAAVISFVLVAYAYVCHQLRTPYRR